MRPQRVGCIPTYCAGRLSIAVQPAAVAVIRRFLRLTGVLSDKAEFPQAMMARVRWPGCMMRSRSM